MKKTIKDKNADEIVLDKVLENNSEENINSEAIVEDYEKRYQQLYVEEIKKIRDMYNKFIENKKQELEKKSDDILNYLKNAFRDSLSVAIKDFEDRRFRAIMNEELKLVYAKTAVILEEAISSINTTKSIVGKFMQDSIENLQDEQEKDNIVRSKNKINEALDMAIRRISNQMSNIGLFRYEPEIGSTFDESRQEVIATVPTQDKEKHQTIASVVNAEYVVNNRHFENTSLIPARVILYQYSEE
ncbi:MAG: hypothetical protein QW255_04425 [Candidatus Bilamarchaeaceae archaeon]